jgi:hypothetical protein
MSAIFLALLKKEGLVPVTEHRFHPTINGAYSQIKTKPINE